MKPHSILALLLFCIALPLYGNDPAPKLGPFTHVDPLPRVVLDPQSKIAFYLESDQCHVSAIDSSGKLLWCRNMFPFAGKLHPHISKFVIRHGYLNIEGEGGGFGSMGASLDEKTGEPLAMSAI
jgi:hypothetical protein